MTENKTGVYEKYQSWEEIFPSNEERLKQFNEFLNELKSEYVSNNSFVSMTQEDKGEIQKTVINKTCGSVEIDTLKNGNVELKFVYPDHTSTGNITPDVGIVDFRWTHNAVKYLRKGLDIYKQKTKDFKHTYKVGQLAFYAKGKPATKDWEDTMKFNNFTPIRLGFKIYPSEILTEASILLKQNGI